MTGEAKPPIVVKRIKRGGAKAHSAAWKIAYADFVTAMMAFFLLMWLLGSTTKGDLEGIAEYFKNPLKVAMQGGSGSGDATSVIQGGGLDLSRQAGQIKKGELPPERKLNLRAAQAELERLERDRLSALKMRIEQAIEQNPLLKGLRQQIRVELTPDGLRIQVIEEGSRPMFDSGSAHLREEMRAILRALAPIINELPNRISLSGHTDAKPYAGGERGYSNWELSADRANASRREIVAGGIADDKIIRVVGLGSAVMLDAADPNNPANRRISITVLNQKAEKRILEVPEPEVAAAEAGHPEPPALAPPASGK
ncbi:MAG TPA: flagellar motor protein MotB [Casimicrobiaceae bacterium]|nr:flagellar motor protein MotB [Casimicrobiaceae bacterium]